MSAGREFQYFSHIIRIVHDMLLMCNTICEAVENFLKFLTSRDLFKPSKLVYVFQSYSAMEEIASKPQCHF